MAVQTTERTKCKRKKLTNDLMAFAKKTLMFLLLRPATWQFIMVHLPVWIDKAYSIYKSLLSLFGDFQS